MFVCVYVVQRHVLNGCEILSNQVKNGNVGFTTGSNDPRPVQVVKNIAEGMLIRKMFTGHL